MNAERLEDQATILFFASFASLARALRKAVDARSRRAAWNICVHLRFQYRFGGSFRRCSEGDVATAPAGGYESGIRRRG
ncbi:MAG: hypothetical protein ACRD2A_20450, partial [Vicinamibacterales bacterium]